MRGTRAGFELSVRRDGSTAVVHASSLVLATGGRQADRAARRSLVAGEALLPPLRGNAYSRGDGALIASALGAQTNFANKGFYGHLFADGVEPIAPLDFITFALYHSEEGVLFDRAGRRFADETRGDHNNTMAVAEQGGRALLLWSEEVQERAGGRPFVGGSLPMDRWGFSRDRGGRVDSAADAAALLAIAHGWGYDLDGGRSRRARGSRPARNGAGLRSGRRACGHDDVRRSRGRRRGQSRRPRGVADRGALRRGR